jgi:hypothetical protein
MNTSVVLSVGRSVCLCSGGPRQYDQMRAERCVQASVHVLCVNKLPPDVCAKSRCRQRQQQQHWVRNSFHTQTCSTHTNGRSLLTRSHALSKRCSIVVLVMDACCSTQNVESALVNRRRRCTRNSWSVYITTQ